MRVILFIGFMISSFLITLPILSMMKGMFTEAGFVRSNFRKEKIPSGMGLVFFLSALMVIATGRALHLTDRNAYTFLFAAGSMTLFGLVDDVFGTRHASGLKGHLKELTSGSLTTGALKALVGGFIALLVSLEVREGAGLYRWVFLLTNTLIIALSTNMINLLDLRPGRAGKGFLVTSGFLIVAGAGQPQLLYLAAVAGSLVAFLPHDLKAGAMMGDTGSNMLGMTLGYTAVFVLAIPVKIAFLLILIGLHLLTEKYSLTELIAKNKLLNYLDMIGRKQ